MGVDDVIDLIGNTSPQILGFFEIAKQDLHRLRPTGTDCFLGGVNKLRECLDLGRGILSCLSELNQLPRLFLGVALGDKRLNGLLDIGDIHGQDVQRLGQNIRSQPTFLKRITERTLRFDILFSASLKFLRSLNQQILKDLTTHTGVDDRVPVHELDRTSGQCLG